MSYFQHEARCSDRLVLAILARLNKHATNVALFPDSSDEEHGNEANTIISGSYRFS